MSRKLLIFFIFFLAIGLRVWNLRFPDITADEHHYINDAQRFDRGDPYISWRHHSFQHPGPNIGHPFLVQGISAGMYRVIGYSVNTIRLPSVLAGLGAIGAILLFDRALGGFVAIGGAALLAVIPFAVRFNRDAHLDSFLELWVTLIALGVWKYIGNKNKNWLVLVGIFSGLAISTKLNGVIGLIMALVLLLTQRKKWADRRFLKEVVWITVPAGLVWLLLNDSGAYLDGILNPADPGYSIFNLSFWGDAVRSIGVWGEIMINLLSPGLFLIWLYSTLMLIRWKDIASIFLLVWQLSLLSLFVFHRPQLSGEYGLLPIISAIGLSVAYVFKREKWRKKWIGLTMLSILPFTYWYGLRIKPVPYLDKSYAYNRTVSDAFYQDVLNLVNKIAPEKGKVFFLPQTGYPMFALRSDLSWSYYGELNNFEMLVVEDPRLISDNVGDIEIVKKLTGREDGKDLVRYVYIIK